MRSSPHHFGRFLLVLLAALVVVGTLTTEAVLQREETRARGALRSAVARLEVPADGAEAARLGELQAMARTRDLGATHRLLDRHVQDHPTVEGHAALATAARATGRFGTAGRHQVLSARLAPRDERARAVGEQALDLALLGRLRLPLRLAALLSGVYLLGAGVAARTRRRRQHRRRAWVHGVDATVALQVDGRGDADGRSATIGPGTESVVVDVFLRPQRAGQMSPRPGPTLSLVLSHAATSTSLRLTPHRDVRGDAVRTRLKDATLGRLLAQPGTWRLQARLDDRVLAETKLLVTAPDIEPRRLRILADQTV